MKEKRNFAKWILPIVAIGVAVALPLIQTGNYNHQLFITVLYSIVVVTGLNFITGLTGQMNLGTAGIFLLGAYTSGLISQKINGFGVAFGPWIGLLCAIVMGIIIGLALGYPSLRVKGVYLSLTTIGFSEIVRIFATNMVDVTGGSAGLKKIPSFSLFGYSFDSARSTYYLYLVLTIILVFVAYRIVNSKWGRAFKSIKDNSEATEAMGINVSSLKILAFTLAAIYGCIAGAMYAHSYGYLSPNDFTVDFSINFVIMLIIGGIGSVPGNILGAILIVILPEMLRSFDQYYWLIFSIITLLFVVFLPNGIVSLFDKATKSIKKSQKGKGELL